MKANRTLLTVIVSAAVAGAGSAYADSRTNDNAGREFGKRARAYLTIAKDLMDLSTTSVGVDKDMAEELATHASDWHDGLDMMFDLFHLASEMTCKADESLVMASMRGRANHPIRLLDHDLKYVNRVMALIEKPGLAEQARVFRDALHETRDALEAASK
jgi:hypothetical protein